MNIFLNITATALLLAPCVLLTGNSLLAATIATIYFALLFLLASTTNNGRKLLRNLYRTTLAIEQWMNS